MVCLGRGNGVDECGPSYLKFSGADDLVYCASAASIDDLPSAGDMTLEAWIKAAGYGENNEGRIFDKSAGDGWAFFVDSANGLEVIAYYNIANANSYSGLDDFTADDQWHHVAAVWDNATATWSLYIDGVEPTYGLQQAGNAVYQVDAANDLAIGDNFAASNRCFDGLIGWARISDNQRYTANFTPPARCTLPDNDANTILLEIFEGAGPTAYNVGADHSHGVLVGALWGCDCTIENDPTCDNEVYVANKSNISNITDIYWYDASGPTWSSNLQNQTVPQMLFPTVPAVGDILYVGTDTTIFDTGPFVSLVFDLIAGADITITEEYWNGAWVALATSNPTDSFEDSGVNSLHWLQPIDWATTAVNGVTGYWVRFRVSGIGANPAPAFQQNRHIYTITWPHIEIDEDQITGDLDKLIKINVDVESDGPLGIGSPPFGVRLWANRVLVGARSVRRGSSFTPFINVSNEQNNADITVTALQATSTFYTGTPRRGPAENHIRYNPAAGIIALRDEVRIDFGDIISPQYRGRFQLFMRVYNDTSVAGNPTDFELQVSMILGNTSGLPAFTSDVITTTNENITELVYLGLIDIVDNNYINGISWSDISFSIAVGHTVALASTLWIYDLILFPVDEWAGDFIDPYWESAPVPGAMGHQAFADGTRLMVDSISNPKRNIQSLLLDRSANTEIISQYRHATNDRSGLSNTNASGLHSNVRLYFLFQSAEFDPGAPGTTLDFASKYEIGARISLDGIGRYLSMRGDR